MRNTDGEREQRLAHESYETTSKHPDSMLDQMANHLEHRLALLILDRQMALMNELMAWLIMEGSGRTSDLEKLIRGVGANVDAREGDGDPLLALAAAHGNLDALMLLLGHGADKETRDHEGATPLVLSCINGHAECTEALLAAGAKLDAKWQYLTPIQWAHVKSRGACEAACNQRGGVVGTLPAGRGVTTDPNRNRLLPPPAEAPRRRRKAMSVKAAAPIVGGGSDTPIGQGSAEGGGGPNENEGGGGAAVAAAGMAPDVAQAWSGREWVQHSLLTVLLDKRSDDARRGELLKQYKCLANLDICLRKCLYRECDVVPARLHSETIRSVSLRPALRLRAKDDDPDLHRRVTAMRCVHSRLTCGLNSSHSDCDPHTTPPQECERKLLRRARCGTAVCGARAQPTQRLPLLLWRAATVSHLHARGKHARAHLCRVPMGAKGQRLHRQQGGRRHPTRHAVLSHGEEGVRPAAGTGSALLRAARRAAALSQTAGQRARVSRPQRRRVRQLLRRCNGDGVVIPVLQVSRREILSFGGGFFLSH